MLLGAYITGFFSRNATAIHIGRAVITTKNEPIAFIVCRHTHFSFAIGSSLGKRTYFLTAFTAFYKCHSQRVSGNRISEG